MQIVGTAHSSDVDVTTEPEPYSEAEPDGYRQWPTPSNQRVEIPIAGRDITTPDNHNDDHVYMELFQSGRYDKPLIFFEGFDPINKNSISYHNRLIGRLFQEVRANGWDLWLVDLSSGGQRVLETARENALAISYAYKYDSFDAKFPGREVATVGISMGALAGRIALASWEDGLYNCDYGTSGGECLDPDLGDGTFTPPVSLFIAINGPQTGANIPTALQMLVQDVSNMGPLGEPEAAIKSLAAQDLLSRYVRPDDCPDVSDRDL